MFTLIALLTMSAAANAMSYEQARNEALFLTDKMAYELNLTDEQYEAAYEINLDYLMGVTSYDDVYGIYWERRNLDLSYILYSWQWEAFRAASYFYRPLYWSNGFWHFGIYARYPHRDYFYFGRPHFYATYRGGHSWHYNGGHSYYHGRSDHFRPSLSGSHQQHGMRNRFDNGDYHNNRGYRHGSSTNVTAGNRDNHSFGRTHSDNHSYGNSNSSVNSHSTAPSRTFGGSRSSSSYNPGSSNSSVNSHSTAPSRSFGGSRSSSSYNPGSSNSSANSHSTAPSRSFGGSRSSSSHSSAGSRGSSSSHSSSGSSHGHFGGSRR